MIVLIDDVGAGEELCIVIVEEVLGGGTNYGIKPSYSYLELFSYFDNLFLITDCLLSLHIKSSIVGIVVLVLLNL